MTSDGRDNLGVFLPVLFVDEVLPTLKDTELRVLLVVLRQTHVARQERASVWMTSGELRRRTGRASEAVSAAIGSLSNRGLLAVTDESGRRLVTASERQCAIGRRFYSVSVDALRKAKSDVGESKTIDINTNKHYGLRFSEGEAKNHRLIEQERNKIRERLRQIQRGAPRTGIQRVVDSAI